MFDRSPNWGLGGLGACHLMWVGPFLFTSAAVIVCIRRPCGAGHTHVDCELLQVQLCEGRALVGGLPNESALSFRRAPMN